MACVYTHTRTHMLSGRLGKGSSQRGRNRMSHELAERRPARTLPVAGKQTRLPRSQGWDKPPQVSQCRNTEQGVTEIWISHQTFCDSEKHSLFHESWYTFFWKCFLSLSAFSLALTINPTKLACISHCNLSWPNLLSVSQWHLIMLVAVYIFSAFCGPALLMYQQLVSYSRDHGQWSCSPQIFSLPRRL